MVDPDVIGALLAQLREYTDDLEAMNGITYDELCQDKVKRRYLERTLQIAIEACLDIGHHLISAQGWRQPKDYRDIITILSEQGVLAQDKTVDLQRMAQFRNLVVHNYAQVDVAKMYGILKDHRRDLRDFAADVARYLRGLDILS